MGNICECLKNNNLYVVNEFKLDENSFLDRRKKLNKSIEKYKGNNKEITKETSKENSAIFKNISNIKNKNEYLFTINDSISIIEANQNEELSFMNNEEINKIFQVNETNNNFENYQSKKLNLNKRKIKGNFDENDFSNFNQSHLK
jgi:hypothetical protein